MAPTTKSVALEDSVELARAGNRAALETVIELVQDKIYGLALRMLWHPEDARDATQEILIRAITHLSGFRRESAFMTWTYRIAANYLTSVRKSRLEEQSYTFVRFGKELDEGLSELSSSALNHAEQAILLQEVRIGCTMGMLLCLDRPHRLAYILGEILELDNREAANVLGIAPAAFRQRLARSRRAIVSFTMAKCGLVNRENPCRCSRRVNSALASKRLDPEHLLFANDRAEAERFPALLPTIRALKQAQRAAALYRLQPQDSTSGRFTSEIRKVIQTLGL
jgi:RNA polymerase sigma factor (sigma-70 family)